jgi:glycosyltransferase involved in cell wall biosynthesis
MYRDASVAVVVPAHNEGAFVGEVLDTMPSFVDRVYVVDDCSTDETWSVIQDRAEPELAVEAATDGGQRTAHRLVPIRHESNRGRGAAIKTGYRRALEDGQDVVAVMDGDGQMDPAQLERLVAPVVAGDVHYAKGNRLGRPADWRGMSVWRLFGNVLLTGLTRVASGYWSMRDPQNGFTVIDAETLAQLDTDRLYDAYGLPNDPPTELNGFDGRLADVGMPAVYGDEESGIRYSRFVPTLSFLLLRGLINRLVRKYVWPQFHPIAGLYALGVTGIGLQAGHRLRSLVGRAPSGRAAGVGPLGWLSLASAMLLDKWHNDHLVSTDRRSDDE